ncbi:hypothetical protein O6P43_009255 [Quillaja saponaria]|uniref:Uncharacterized protein n=1 Tax=Quillaja saponaria TaxID=32244 RepID=A0AAD7VCY8_QUISA|nr:hypothetical protein O6P43_009255 [Quillaja saponaria]
MKAILLSCLLFASILFLSSSTLARVGPHNDEHEGGDPDEKISYSGAVPRTRNPVVPYYPFLPNPTRNPKNRVIHPRTPNPVVPYYPVSPNPIPKPKVRKCPTLLTQLLKHLKKKSHKY